MIGLSVDILTTPSVMILITVIMAILWGAILEVSRKWVYDALATTEWWPRAAKPTMQMMTNFGYPKSPNKQFPNAVTESMARDFFSFLSNICVQHFLSALPMIPALLSGWENASELARCMFVLGTLSDVGYDLYDSIKSSIRTFQKDHPAPLPLDYWIVVIAMHHTLALFLVLPMNAKYLHLADYQQTVVSLLLAASICYAAGNYKFTLNILTPSGFYQYKAIVLIQLFTILYTRVYLWFPALFSILSHLSHDKIYFYGGCFMGLVFSLFNVLLVFDSLQAAVKWLPMTMPKNEKEAEENVPPVQDGYGAAPVAVFDLVVRMRRRKLKGAVHSVIAMNRMKKATSLKIN